MSMETSSQEQKGRAVHSTSSDLPNVSKRQTGRLPYRPIGSSMRCVTPSSQLQVPATREASGRLEHLLRVAFINRNFALLWWGQAVSSVGDYAWDTALVLWVATYLVAGQSWAPLAVSGVVLAATLPQIVVGPIAGVFVDRWDKRKTMVTMAVLQGVFAVLLVLPAASFSLPFIGHVQLPLFWRLGVVFIDVALLATFAQFFIPAQLAIIKDIVPQERQDQALEMYQGIQGLAVIIGPPVAAALVFGVGVVWALVLNALSFVVVFFASFAIKAPPSARSLATGESGHFTREFLDGLGYVTSHVALRTILVAEVLTWLGFGALQSLGYFFITGNLHASASAYGLLGADFGVGAVVGAVLVTILGKRIGLARLLWMALVASGLFVIVMSHLTSLYPALIAAFLFGVSTTAVIVTAGPLTLDNIAREFVGRVTAVINPLGRLAALLSVALAGSLVSTVLHGLRARVLGISFGPVDSVFTGLGLLAVIGGIYTRVSLRGMIAKQSGSTSEGEPDLRGAECGTKR